MYRTYSTNEEEKKPVYPYEERLVPKEVSVAQQPVEEEKQPEVTIDSMLGGMFDNIAVDDIIIVGILFFLLYQDCDDWILILALLGVLILR